MEQEQQEEFNGQIKAIFRGGRINPIDWGGEGSEEYGWESWEVERKLAYAMELASAMNQAADVLQKERNQLLTEIKIAKQAAENAESSMRTIKSIMTNQMLSGNETIQTLSLQIQELQAELAKRDATIFSLKK